MDLFDKLALWGRRYERQINPGSGGKRFALRDLLEFFRQKTILELTPVVGGKPGETYRPDPVRKLKISILDEGVSAFGKQAAEWYEIAATAASGDFARMKVLAYATDGVPSGELRMLVAERMPELYFREDPIFAAVSEGRGPSSN
jgi:hypothetical protein